MKTTLFILAVLILSGCHSHGVDRLMGTGDSKEETLQKYPWLASQSPYTPEFCSRYKDICHDAKIPGY